MSELDVPIRLDDAMLVGLAREIATDIRPIDDVIKTFKLSLEDWDAIKGLPRFTALLEQHVAEWAAARNTLERTRVKAGAMVEDWLPEAHARLHDSKETLSAKNELAKIVTRLAGMGLERADGSNTTEKFTVTINLGGGKLAFEHQLPPKVISPDAGD